MKATFRAALARLFENQVRRLIKRHNLQVVAVAGSVGKTTTRMAVRTVLKRKFRSQSITQPGYNSEVGLPLSVFEMSVPQALFNPFAWIARLIRTEQVIRSKYPYQMLVLELGTDHPGEMARYIKYLTPDICVMTAITPEHMENFSGGMDAVAAEELLLVASSKQVVAGHDDIASEYRRKYIDRHPSHHYYGLGARLEYGITVDSTDVVNGTKGDLTKNGHAALKNVSLNLYGMHSAKVAAAAYAVGDLLGLTKHELEAGLAEIHPVSGRMNVLAGMNGSIIIDDTYNSSPDAVAPAIEALMSAPVTGRRIAILGSMNELGVDSPKYHEQVGAVAASVDLLVTVGELANSYLGPAAVAAGLDPTRFKPADSPYAAGEYLKVLLREGDIVLAKGSQNGVFAEEAVKLLLKSPDDTTKLVRQSGSWRSIKARQFPDQVRTS